MRYVLLLAMVGCSPAASAPTPDPLAKLRRLANLVAKEVGEHADAVEEDFDAFNKELARLRQDGEIPELAESQANLFQMFAELDLKIIRQRGYRPEDDKRATVLAGYIDW